MVILVVESALVMVDEPRDCYTEWRKSEGEKQVLYINAYIYGEGNGTPLQYSCLENPMGEPGGLQSMGLRRVGHDWVTELNWTENKLILKKASTFYLVFLYIFYSFAETFYFSKKNWFQVYL